MLRGIGITLAVLLCLVLVAAGFGGWRLNSRLEDLNVALLDLKNQVNPNRAANHSPEITGFCFLKDRSQPAAGAELELRQLPSLDIVRRLRTDKDGRFRSGPLVVGDYCVLAPLIGPQNPLVGYTDRVLAADIQENYSKPLYWIQTEPLYLRDDVKADKVELDLHFACGSVLVAPKYDLPATIEVPSVAPEARGGMLTLPLDVQMQIEDTLVGLPWRPRDPLPPKWPAIGKISRQYSGSSPLPLKSSPDPIPLGQFVSGKHSGMPAGTYRLGVLMSAVMPTKVFGGAGGGGGIMGGMGTQGGGPPQRSMTEVTIHEGETALVEVRFPDDAIERLPKSKPTRLIYQPPIPIAGEVKVVSIRREESKPAEERPRAAKSD